MSVRHKIVGKTPPPPVAPARVRRKRDAAPEPVEEGKVIAIPDEEITVPLLKKSPLVPDKFRGGKYLHVSDILHKCLRKIALTEREQMPMPTGALMDGQAITFAQGTALHDHVKGRLVKGHPDKVYGTWSCVCKNVHVGPCLRIDVPDTPCPNCNTPATEYNELELKDDELLVTGSPDVTLVLRKGVFTAMEIKSINGKDFATLERPIPDHIMQVTFYWLLFKRLGYNVTNKISILYVNKEYSFKSPYQEFVLDATETVKRLDPYLETTREFVAFRNGGDLPCRTHCANINSQDAKKCHVAVICFSDGD